MGNTVIEIRDRMLGNIPDGLDVSEGSFFWDLLASVAIELGGVTYIKLEDILRLGFALTTEGIYMDYKAAEHGLTRLSATYAEGEVTFTGVDATVIPEGTLVASEAGVQFVTMAEAVISGTTVDAAIKAFDSGASGNLPSATIKTMPVSLAGIISLTNAAPTIGGTAAETDAALLERLLDKVRQPATSGNVYHYEQWARAVDGVGDAKVDDEWDGPGTVKVYLVDADKEPVAAPIVTACGVYIETVRPIGADVTVVAATEVTIDVAATLTLASGYEIADVAARAETGVQSYIKSVAFIQDYVSIAQVGNAIIDTAGVLDYSGLTLNSGTANVALSFGATPVLATVSLTEA